MINNIRSNIVNPTYDMDNFPEKIIHTMQKIVSKEFMDDINNRKIFPSTITYMCYWYDKFKKMPKAQNDQFLNVLQYVMYGSNRTLSGIKKETNHHLLDNYQMESRYIEDIKVLLNSREFLEESIKYVIENFPIRKTVDLFITTGEKHINEGGDMKFLAIQRDEFPTGKALPGGIVLGSDEQNSYNIPGPLFAALRVAGAKVLEKDEENLEYGLSEDQQSYFVKEKNTNRGLLLKKKNNVGYHYKDSIKNMIEPSDPRSIVDTMGYKMEYFGGINDKHNRIPYQDIKNIDQKDLIFSHQRKLLRGLSAKTESILENDKTHHEFIREIIENPKVIYDNLKKRFVETNYSPDTSMPEFLSTVKYLETELFSERVNMLCKNDTALVGWRDIVFNNLNHLHLNNRDICPYLHTIVSIEKTIEFFDIITRKEMGFYQELDQDKPLVHNPAEVPHARYHGYKYQYRFNDYFHNPNFKKEIIIPTFLHVGATDLMRMRGVPIRIAGISTDLLYVDEFEQTPLEFWCHDLNHCRRYALEDIRVAQNLGITLEELYEKSSKDVEEYMSYIIINKDDSPEVKAKKRMKKIILFEIVHEDARVFLKETIFDILLKMEGEDVPFEWRSFNPETNEGTVVDIKENYIHTLSYVRYKLQEGFYDTFDDQKSYIVDKDYRYSRNIADVAYEMLNELEIDFDFSKRPDIVLDEEGKISKEWIMERIWSFGPPEVQEPKFIDPDQDKYYKGQKSATTREYDV